MKKQTNLFFLFLSLQITRGSSGSFSSQISGRYDVFEMRLSAFSFLKLKTHVETSIRGC